MLFFGFGACRGDLRPGPADQPALRDVLRLVVGGLCRSSLFFGPVWQGDQPGPHHQRGSSRKLTGGDPDRGVFDYPERLGYWPAALGLFAFVWIELVYPYAHRARAGPAVVRGVRRGDAHRRRALRQHASTSAPTRSRSTPRWSAAVGLGPPRRACWWSAARWPTSIHRPGPARPGRGGRGALRQHGVRLVPRLHALGAVHPGQRRVAGTCSTTWPCWGSASRSGWCSRPAPWLTGVRPATAAQCPAGPVRALDRADRGRATSSPTTSPTWSRSASRR